jgi:hypothetical protein
MSGAAARIAVVGMVLINLPALPSGAQAQHARLKLAEAGRAQAMLDSGEVIGELLPKP